MLQYLFLAVSLALILLAALKAEKKRYAVTIFVSLAYMALLLFFTKSVPMLAYTLPAILVATSLFYDYGKRNAMFLAEAVFLVALLMYWAYKGLPLILLMKAVGGAMIVSIIPNLSNSANREGKRTEVKRDIVQIILGIIVMAIIYFLPEWLSYPIIFALIFVAGVANSYMSSSSCAIAKFLKSLERSNVTFGAGAIYIAVSTMLLMGFVYSKPFLLFGIAALFISDSFATIIGINGRHKIRRKKTVEGSLGYFLSLAAIGYTLIGLWALPLALFLAAVEIESTHIDDNILVPSAYIIVYLLAVTSSHL